GRPGPDHPGALAPPTDLDSLTTPGASPQRPAGFARVGAQAVRAKIMTVVTETSFTSPIPLHLAFHWYAPHQAWLRAQGRTPHHDPGDEAPARARLSYARLSDANLSDANL